MAQGFIRNNVNQFAFMYRLVDIALIHLAWYAVIRGLDIEYTFEHFLLALIANVAYSFVAEMFWLYRSWRAGGLSEMLFYTALSWGIALFPLLSFVFFAKVSDHYSRLALGAWVCSVLFLLCSWRVVLRYTLFGLRRNGRNTRSVGIIGCSELGSMLAHEILEHPETGYQLKGIYDDRESDRLPQDYRSLRRGNVEEAMRQAAEGGLEVLFVGLPFSAKGRIEKIMRRLGDTTVDVHLIPDFFIFNLLHARIGQVGDIQTVSVYDTPMRGGWSFLKRLEDLLLSFMALAVAGIPMLLIAIGVKLSSPGPVLFRQDRYGLDGRRISVLKFRTMTVTENDANLKQATRNDARITRFGAFLRRTSLDELPQFFNVIQGTMSVVGPRPHAVAHNEAFRKQVAFYMLRHKMKPGITGWAQVHGWRGETDTLDKIQKRIEFDLDYIHNWSLWMDFKILLATVRKGFVNDNAY
ncbi:MAG: undecaprenyl-phosphate glucose phosphotransferase [Pseudomonadota bacterium]|nr:undecaprenyl-phosphate glucose phosphotransferase [Pseudomonadota bacterium]